MDRTNADVDQDKTLILSQLLNSPSVTYDELTLNKVTDTPNPTLTLTETLFYTLDDPQIANPQSAFYWRP